jgi:hypothetical protein
MKRTLTSVVALSIAAGLAAGVGSAKERAQPAPEAKHDTYVPDLADLMFLTQLRFVKLWYAGRVGHWEVADYELSKMKHSLEVAAKFYPTFDNVPLADLVGDESNKAMAELENAVRTKNSKEFAGSFYKVIAACNECHRKTNRDFIIVVTPTVL